MDGGRTYFTQLDWCATRVWYFKLAMDGQLVRDLVPANCPDGRAGFFDRVTRAFVPNAGKYLLAHGAERPGVSLDNSYVMGGRLCLTLTRTGTEASDVYVAYGNCHGGATPGEWEHFEKVPSGFAAGQTSVDLTLGAGVSSYAYVRIFSQADGWSDSAFIPETKVRKGMMLFIR